MTQALKIGDECLMPVTIEDVSPDGDAEIIYHNANGDFVREWVEQSQLALVRRAPIDLATCDLPVEVIEPSGDRGVLDARGGCWGLVKSDGGRHAPWLLSDLRPAEALIAASKGEV